MLPTVITVERLFEDSSHQSGPTFVPPQLVFCFFPFFSASMLIASPLAHNPKQQANLVAVSFYYSGRGLFVTESRVWEAVSSLGTNRFAFNAK